MYHDKALYKFTFTLLTHGSERHTDPQVPRTKHRRVLTATPPPHSREQLLHADHSLHKYTGSRGGLAGRTAAGLGRCLEIDRDSCCLVPGRFPRLSSTRPSEPLFVNFVTTTALLESGYVFTETQSTQCF